LLFVSECKKLQRPAIDGEVTNDEFKPTMGQLFDQTRRDRTVLAPCLYGGESGATG
jgi:hypothetical protein